MKQLASILILALLTVACPTSTPIEKTARDGIATAKGFLDSEKTQHQECIGGSFPACDLINKAVAAKDVTIDALEAYCSGPAFDAGTGPCTPQAALKDKLTGALTNLNQTIADIKNLK
jgi:hypothetical protein